MKSILARLALVAWLGLGALLLVVPPAWGYIDPGAGGLLIQSLVAGAMATGLVIKTQWRRLRRLVTRSGKGDRRDAR
ncbi:MAG: hypothetical protein M3133_05100 [Actinomycetota bacterium]|nr:hypothetical protein [Actinomycetota bacterium]